MRGILIFHVLVRSPKEARGAPCKLGASAIQRLHACALLLDRAMGTKSSRCLTAAGPLMDLCAAGIAKGIARAGGATARILVREGYEKASTDRIAEMAG